VITTVYGTAGTGKTTWLINDAIQRVEQGQRVGIFSFSTSAIQEIKERMLLLNPPEWIFDDIRTIHSLAYINTIGSKRLDYAIDKVPYKFLRYKRIPYSKDAFDTAKKGNAWIAAITYAIQRAKSKDLNQISDMLYEYSGRFGLLQMTTWEAIALFKEYEAWKREHGLMDFNDILLEFHEKISKLGSMASYDVVYIDEAQDLSPLTMDIILNAFDVDEIYLVGDPLQNIYENLLGTSMDLFMHVGEKEILLDRGYRVPQNIFNLALYNSGAPTKIFSLYSKVKHVEERGIVIERSNLTLIELIHIIREMSDRGYTPSILLPKNRHVVTLAEELVRFGIIPTSYKKSSPINDMVDLVTTIVDLKGGKEVKFDKVIKSLINLGVKEDDPNLKVLESPLYDATTKASVLFRLAQRLGFVVDSISSNKIYHVVIDTIHASKGRENDVIIVPFFKSYKIKNEQLARRLFFVGATRTKKILVLVHNLTIIKLGRGWSLFKL